MKSKFSSMWRVAIALVLALSLSLVMAVPALAADLTSITAAPDDNVAGATGVTYTIAFDTATALAVGAPADQIIITFSAGFDASSAAVHGDTVTQSTTDPTLVTATATVVTLDVGADEPAGTQSIVLSGIVNTETAGDAHIVTIETQDGAAGNIDGPTTSPAFEIVADALDAYTVVPAAVPYTAGVAFDVVITAVDEFLNPLGADYVTDEPYTWVTNANYAPNGTGPDIGTLVASDFTEGVATKSVTLYAAESNVIFTITDDSAITATSAVITVDPEALAAYTVVPDGLTQTAGTPFNVTITAVDQFENPLGSAYTDPGGVYTWTTTAGGTPVIGTTPVFADFMAGVVTKSVTLDFIETGVTFTITDGTAITGTSAGVAVVAGPAVYLVVTGDATMTAGGTNELTVTAYDAAVNVATSYTGSKTLIFSGPGVAPDATAPTVEGITMENETTVTFTAGVSVLGSATLIAYKAETPTVDVTDGMVNSFADPAYDLDLTVDPAAAAQLAYTAEPATVVAGVETSKFTVQRQDLYANPTELGGALVVIPASTSTGTAKEFRAPSGSANVVETVTILADTSTADFYYYDEKAGAWTITASSGALTPAESALTVDPAGIDHYWVSPIASPQVTGAAFEVTIKAQDEYNNDVTTGTEAIETITVTYGVADVDATPLGAAAFSTAAGAATVDVRLTVITLGQSITFKGAESLESGTSNPFQTVDVGAIHHYTVTAIPVAQEVGEVFNVIIQAQDANNNDITLGSDAAEAITITFGLTDAGATWTLTPSETTDGVATIPDMTMSVGQAGQTIIVTGDISSVSGISNSFTVYDVIMPSFPADTWVLISIPLSISTDSAWIDEPALVYKADGSVFSTDVTLAVDLVPVSALYVKMGSEEGSLGIIFSTGAQGVSTKELEAGWNLISSANSEVDNAPDVLSGLRDVASDGTGLTTVVSQTIYSAGAGFYVDATEWPGDLATTTLDATEGYWIHMNAAKTFSVVPGF